MSCPFEMTCFAANVPVAVTVKYMSVGQQIMQVFADVIAEA